MPAIFGDDGVGDGRTALLADQVCAGVAGMATGPRLVVDVVTERGLDCFSVIIGEPSRWWVSTG
ncbi:MAG: hypothetical protein WKF83_11830 [Nocardioidaceae bacterium]